MAYLLRFVNWCCSWTHFGLAFVVVVVAAVVVAVSVAGFECFRRYVVL